MLAAALLAFLAGAGVAAAGVADQVGATFGLMIADVVRAFAPVEGMLVAVEGDRVYVDLAERDGVRIGQELTVFRKTEVFRHPLNKRPLGRFEEVLGYAQVRRVFDRFSEADFIRAESTLSPRPEDGVRITRGRIKIAVPPPIDLTGSGADLRRVPYMVALGLEQTRRFQAVDPGTVRDTLLARGARVEEVLVVPERAVALGKGLEVQGWVIPVLLERRGVAYLDVTWVSAVSGRPLFSRRMALTRADAAAQRFPWEPVPAD
jgi:hypothetical protein